MLRRPDTGKTRLDKRYQKTSLRDTKRQETPKDKGYQKDKRYQQSRNTKRLRDEEIRNEKTMARQDKTLQEIPNESEGLGIPKVSRDQEIQKESRDTKRLRTPAKRLMRLKTISIEARTQT